MPGLDLLRGLAVLLVLLNHAHPLFGGAGVVGVTIFFALSGYLITGVVVRDIYRTGGVRLAVFYRNRALRLVPPLLLLLLGYVLVEGVLNHLGERDLVPQSVAVALTYTTNIPGIPHGSGSLYHLWTLATEEQFYLLWPLVLMWGFRRVGLRRVVILLGAGVAMMCVLTIKLTEPDVARIYALPSSWWLTIMIGSVAYLGRAELSRVLPSAPQDRRTLQVAILAAIALAAAVPGLAHSAAMYLLVAPTIAAGTAVLITYASRWERLPSPALRPLLHLGTISYAAYLWNAAIMRWLEPVGGIVASVLVVVLTLAAATASWWLVERPVQRLRVRLDARTPVRA
ncbi:acyltransferase family protein [Cellulomonas sp. P22]|uniref:acyltransferase family protein n=1 Tax=Cellulomonas sp. P22 TaxID=3373189 RepID=UPI0037A7746D